MDGHIWSENIMVMNSKKWAGLPIAAQQILSQAARLGVAANNVSERMVSNIVKYEVIASKMKVYNPTPAEKAKFREIAQPAVLEYLRGTVGKETVDRFIAEVQQSEVRTGWRR